jgi:uncharacterized protein (TIGR03437 family)
MQLGQAALALNLNADGTENDCTNPAAAGSMVTVFLNGFGTATPRLATGVIAGRAGGQPFAITKRRVLSRARVPAFRVPSRASLR